MGPRQKKAKKPQGQAAQKTRTQSLTIKRKKMITDIRSGWLSERVRDMREGLRSLKSEEFRRALWEGLKEMDGLISYQDVNRWLKCHSWILEPSGWPAGLRREGPSPPPVVMASYFRHDESPPDLEDQGGIRMGRWPTVQESAVVAEGTKKGQSSQQSPSRQEENIQDLGKPSQVISLRPVEVHQKYLRVSLSKKLVVPSTPVPVTPKPVTSAPPQSMIPWLPIHSKSTKAPRGTPEVTISPPPSSSVYPPTSTSTSTSTSPSSSISSDQTVIFNPPILSPIITPTPPTQHTNISQSSPTPFRSIPVTPKKRILFMTAEYLAGLQNNLLTPSAPVAHLTPPPEASPPPPPPPPPVPDNQVPQAPPPQAPGTFAAMFAGVQQLCSVIQSRQNEVQDSLNALNQSISYINPARSTFEESEPNVWQQRLVQREERNSYPAYFGPRSQTPPPPHHHQPEGPGPERPWSPSPQLCQESHHSISKLTELIGNLSMEAFLSPNPWETSDPRSVDPAKVDYKVKLILNGMDKIVTEYATGLVDQDQLIKLISKFRKVFIRIIQKVIFPVNHRLAMSRIKMEAREEQNSPGGNNPRGERADADVDIFQGQPENVNGTLPQAIVMPILASPPPPDLTPHPRENVAVANVLPVQWRPQVYPIFHGARRPRQYPIPSMDEQTRRAINELDDEGEPINNWEGDHP